MTMLRDEFKKNPQMLIIEAFRLFCEANPHLTSMNDKVEGFTYAAREAVWPSAETIIRESYWR